MELNRKQKIVAGLTALAVATVACRVSIDLNRKVVVPNPQNVTGECVDRIDNDRDGFKDSSDPGCRSINDPSER